MSLHSVRNVQLKPVIVHGEPTRSFMVSVVRPQGSNSRTRARACGRARTDIDRHACAVGGTRLVGGVIGPLRRTRPRDRVPGHGARRPGVVAAPSTVGDEKSTPEKR